MRIPIPFFGGGPETPLTFVSCSPNHGDSAGTTSVTVTGTGFLGVNAIELEPFVTGIAFAIVDDSTITFDIDGAGLGATYGESVDIRIIRTVSLDEIIAVGAFVFDAFEPATLNITDWRQPDFTAFPWAAHASAGTSGSSTETSGVAGNTVTPVAGRVLNGLTSVRYTSGAKGSSPLARSTRITTTAYSVSALIYIESAGAGDNSTPYTEMFLYGEGAGGYEWQITLSTHGVKVSRYNGATWDHFTAACSTGAWHWVDVRFGSGTVEIRIDGGSWSTAAFGAATADVGSTGGVIYNLAATTDFDLMERIISPVRLDDTEEDNLKSYINTKYGTSF